MNINGEHLEKAVNLPWFRMYAEFISDPVTQSLAFEDQRHFVAVLCLKCAGVLDRNITQTMKDKIIIRALGLDTTTADEAKRRLMEVGLIDKKWQPKSWSKRQYLSDHSTVRTRKHRKNKETGNGNRTPDPRHCDGPDTDTDTDTDKRRQGASNRRTDARFEEFWKGYPVKKEKRNARAVWKSKGLDVKADEIMDSVKAFVLSDAQWLRGYIPHPTTFLRGERWNDEIEAVKDDSSDLWNMADAKLLALAEKRGISTGGKLKKDLINELG